MTPTETVRFVNYLAKLFPTFKYEPETPTVWHGAGLAFVTPHDAKAAADALAVRQTFVSLADVVAEVRSIRDRRHDAEPLPDPGTGDDAVYRERIKASITRIGDGFGLGRAALAAAPRRQGPPPATFIEARGRAPQAEAARAVTCPWPPCQARPSTSCVNGLGRPLPHPHHARLVAAGLVQPESSHAANLPNTP